MFDFGERRRQINALKELVTCDFSDDWDAERMRILLKRIRDLPRQLEEEVDSTLEEFRDTATVAEQEAELLRSYGAD